MSKLSNNQVATNEVRLSFVNVFEPTAMKEGDTPRYSVTIIVPKTDTKTVDAVKAAIRAAAENGVSKHFGGKMPVDPVAISTFKDGDTATDDMGELVNEKYPEYKGAYYMRVSTTRKPKVFTPDRTEMIDPEEIYSGCYGRVSINFFAYSGDGRRGISASLNNVMKTRDGERLGSELDGSEFDD